MLAALPPALPAAGRKVPLARLARSAPPSFVAPVRRRRARRRRARAAVAGEVVDARGGCSCGVLGGGWGDGAREGGRGSPTLSGAGVDRPEC